MASKRLGEYIIFPFHRNQGHDKAEAREARMETLVNRILFRTRAYGPAKVHTQLLLTVFPVFFFFKLRDKFNSTAKKSLELVSCVHVHACRAQGGHAHVEVRGQLRGLFPQEPSTLFSSVFLESRSLTALNQPL